MLYSTPRLKVFSLRIFPAQILLFFIMSEPVAAEITNMDQGSAGKASLKMFGVCHHQNETKTGC